jgi:hypothetical protein
MDSAADCYISAGTGLERDVKRVWFHPWWIEIVNVAVRGAPAVQTSAIERLDRDEILDAVLGTLARDMGADQVQSYVLEGMDVRTLRISAHCPVVGHHEGLFVGEARPSAVKATREGEVSVVVGLEGFESFLAIVRCEGASQLRGIAAVIYEATSWWSVVDLNRRGRYNFYDASVVGCTDRDEVAATTVEPEVITCSVRTTHLGKILHVCTSDSGANGPFEGVDRSLGRRPLYPELAPLSAQVCATRLPNKRGIRWPVLDIHLATVQ